MLINVISGVKYATVSLIAIVAVAGNAMAAGTYTTYTKTAENTKYYDPTTGAEVNEADRVGGVEYIEYTVPEYTKQTNDITFNTEYGNKDAGNAEKIDITLSDGTNITYWQDKDNSTNQRIRDNWEYNKDVNTSFVGIELSDDGLEKEYQRTGGGGAAIHVSGSNENIGNITGDFVNNKLEYSGSNLNSELFGGGAIFNNDSTIGNITGNFINNIVEIDETSATNTPYGGGAIYNFTTNSEYHIGNGGDAITGNFIGNGVSAKSRADGGAILNQGQINGNIVGDFVQNFATADNGSANGGAIYSGLESLMHDIDGDFIGNYASGANGASGGAIMLYYSKTGNITGDFIGNYATSISYNALGGAIMGEAATLGNINGDFIGNYAKSETYTASGGAIYAGELQLGNEENIGTIIGDIVGTFAGNYAESGQGYAYGGAIYNSTTSIIDSISGLFIANEVRANSSSQTSGAFGGAIYNLGTITNGISADFVGNSATSSSSAFGGAIYNSKSISDISNNLFMNNTADGGGSASGGAIYNSENINNIINNLFINNTVNGDDASGGAISNAGLIGNIDAYFINNTVYGSYSAYGGAISNDKLHDTAHITKANGVFIGNTAGGMFGGGGAVYNTGTMTLTGTFIENSTSSAMAWGGAIYNEGTLTLTGTFIGNTAESTIPGSYFAEGGAIFNRSGGSITFVGDNLFANNSVSGKESTNWGDTIGGAIYNGGYDYLMGGTPVETSLITFGAGKHVFSQNKAGEVLNDIHNLSDIVIANSAYVYLDGGITGDGTLSIENGGALYSGEQTGIANLVNNNGTIVIADDYALDITNTLNMGSGAFLNMGKASALNITGDYTANDSYLLLSMSYDTAGVPMTGEITVDGDLSGTTHIILDVVNESAPTQTWTKFLTAENDDMNTASDFVLDRVSGSAFAWETALNLNGETDGSHWYLQVAGADVDAPIYVAEVPAYTALHQIAMEQNRGIFAEIQRVMTIEKDIHCHNGETCHFRPSSTKPRLWLTGTYNNATIKTPAEFDASVVGATMGLDLYRDSQTQAGLFAAYRHGSYDLDGTGKYMATFGTDITNDSYVGGVYYRYFYNDFDFFGSAYASIQELDMKTNDHVVTADTRATQYGANIGVAKNFIMNSTMTLSPFVDASYIWMDIAKVHDNAGKTADADRLNYFDAELGILMEYIPYGGNTFTERLYFKPSIVQTFSDGGYTRITGIDNKIKTFDDLTLIRGEIGGQWRLGNVWHAKAFVGYTFGNDYSAFDASAGISVHF